MQNTTSLLLKAITYNHPEELPVFVGILPAARKLHGEAMTRILRKYPAFFDTNVIEGGDQQMAITYYAGEHTDPWGCVWSNLQEGMEAYVTGHPLPNREDIHTLKAPATDMGLPHGFMYLRLLDLRGFEEAMMDFAEEPEELKTLIDTVCDYNVRQVRLLVETNPNPILFFGDDLGMQQGLAIGAQKWRKWMKPAFKRIYDVAHAGWKKGIHAHGWRHRGHHAGFGGCRGGHHQPPVPGKWLGTTENNLQRKDSHHAGSGSPAVPLWIPRRHARPCPADCGAVVFATGWSGIEHRDRHGGAIGKRGRAAFGRG